MEKSVRNIFIGALITIVSAFVGAWIQLNSRIAILEVKVSSDHAQILKTDQDIEQMKEMLYQIQAGVQHLNDIKENKK